MTKTKDIFNSTINELKKNISGLNYYLMIIKYDNEEFYQCHNSIPDFFKKLVNSKRSYMGVYNRTWYKKIKKGFYKSVETDSDVTIYMGLIPFDELDVVDLEGRVINLTPFPINLEIGENDYNMLNGVFSDLTKSLTSISVFGLCRSGSNKKRI